MELTAQAPGLVGARAVFAVAGGGGPLWPSPDAAQIASRAEIGSAPGSAVSRRELEDLWDRHGEVCLRARVRAPRERGGRC